MSIQQGIPQQMVRMVPNEDPSQPSHQYYYTETPSIEVRVSAAKELLNRAFGKSAEIIEITEKQAFNIIHLAPKRDPLKTGELDRAKRELPPAS